MAERLRIPTTAGKASASDTFMQLIEHIRLAEECCYVLAHIATYDENAQMPLSKQKMFMAMGEMFKMTATNVTNLATSKMRKQAGYR
jgi:hypothetical protein